MCLVEAGCVYRTKIQIRIGGYHNLYRVPVYHSYSSVVKIIVLYIGNAIITKFSTTKEPVMNKHVHCSGTVSPHGQLVIRLVGILRQPLEIVVVRFCVFQNLYDIATYVTGHLGRFEQLLPSPTLSYKHTSATLCVRTVRTVPEIPRRHRTKLIKGFELSRDPITNPLQTRLAYRYRTLQYSKRIHGEVCSKAVHGIVPATLDTLVCHELFHIISRLFSSLIFFSHDSSL